MDDPQRPSLTSLSSLKAQLQRGPLLRGEGFAPRVLREYSGARHHVATAWTRGFHFSGPHWTWSNKGIDRAELDAGLSLALRGEGPQLPRASTHVSHCSALALGWPGSPSPNACLSLSSSSPDRSLDWGPSLCLFCVCFFASASCKSVCGLPT